MTNVAVLYEEPYDTSFPTILYGKLVNGSDRIRCTVCGEEYVGPSGKERLEFLERHKSCCPSEYSQSRSSEDISTDIKTVDNG